MPGGEDSAPFSSARGRSFALKSCPQAGILREKKLVGQGLAWGMVTRQSDTRLTLMVY